MRLQTFKLFGLGAALVMLVLAAGNSGQVGLAQASCTVIVQPGQSIQAATDQAAEGMVICLSAGIFEESVKITKSLTLRGAGREQTIIKGQNQDRPIILIQSRFEDQVALEGLTARGSGDAIHVTGESKVALKQMAVSDSEIHGFLVNESAKVSLFESQVMRNKGDGFKMEDSAQVSLSRSQWPP